MHAVAGVVVERGIGSHFAGALLDGPLRGGGEQVTGDAAAAVGGGDVDAFDEGDGGAFGAVDVVTAEGDFDEADGFCWWCGFGRPGVGDVLGVAFGFGEERGHFFEVGGVGGLGPEGFAQGEPAGLVG